MEKEKVSRVDVILMMKLLPALETIEELLPENSEKIKFVIRYLDQKVFKNENEGFENLFFNIDYLTSIVKMVLEKDSQSEYDKLLKSDEPLAPKLLQHNFLYDLYEKVKKKETYKKFGL